MPATAALANIGTSHERAVARGHQIGARVVTEWGTGTVTTSTDRSTGITLDTGETINVQKSTPGHARITAA